MIRCGETCVQRRNDALMGAEFVGAPPWALRATLVLCLVVIVWCARGNTTTIGVVVATNHPTGEWKLKEVDGAKFKKWTKGDVPDPEERWVQEGTFVRGKVTVIATDGVAGATTYQLSISAASSAVRNVYTIFGDVRNPMHLPAAFQAETPFGAHIGGSDPLFYAVEPMAEFDSWLTVGIEDGNSENKVASINIPFEGWTAAEALYVSNGAVFWMQPDDAPRLEDQDVTVGQLTLKSDQRVRASMNAQGRSIEPGNDWEQSPVLFWL